MYHDHYWLHYTTILMPRRQSKRIKVPTGSKQSASGNRGTKCPGCLRYFKRLETHIANNPYCQSISTTSSSSSVSNTNPKKSPQLSNKPSYNSNSSRKKNDNNSSPVNHTGARCSSDKSNINPCISSRSGGYMEPQSVCAIANNVVYEQDQGLSFNVFDEDHHEETNNTNEDTNELLVDHDVNNSDTTNGKFSSSYVTNDINTINTTNVDDLVSSIANELDTTDNICTGPASSNDHHSNKIDLKDVSSQMSATSNHQCFNKQMLCSLKLFQILHKADAPIGLYNEMVTFWKNVFPVLSQCSNYELESRESLLKSIHSMIFSGGSPSFPKKKSRKSNSPSLDNDLMSNNQQDSPDCLSSDDSLKSYPFQTTDHCQSNYVQPTTIDQFPTYRFSLLPYESSIKLDNCNNAEVKISRFDFVSNVVSLLKDPSLMKFENTLYHHKEFLDPVEHSSNSFADVHTSDWFCESFKRYKLPRHQHISNITTINGEQTNVKYQKIIMCPLIFFIDGVAIDSMGRKSLEPVSFTLGIFNQTTRNRVPAWRVLGYVPNVEKTTTIQYSKMKNGSTYWKKHHYHQMLQCIFSQVKNIQSRGGIIYNLPFPGGRLVPTLLKFPIMYIIGDCLGNDKLCNRKQNYVPTKTLKTGVCRDCNVIYKHCDQSNFKCNMISRKFLKSVMRNVLIRMGFSDVELNAFDGLDFGGDNYGINGSTPPESLHQWFLGVVKFVIDYFLDRISNRCKHVLDEIVRRISIHFHRQSDRNTPNIGLFKNGVEKTKLTGSEHGDLLFMIYLAMLPLESKQALVSADQKAQTPYRLEKIRISSRSGDNQKSSRVRNKRIALTKILDNYSLYNKWLGLFEKMISIGEWLKSPSIEKESLKETESMNLYTLGGFENFHNEICRKCTDPTNSVQVSNNDFNDQQKNTSEDIIGEDPEEIDENALINLNDIHFGGYTNDDLVPIVMPEGHATTQESNDLSELDIEIALQCPDPTDEINTSTIDNRDSNKRKRILSEDRQYIQNSQIDQPNNTNGHQNGDFFGDDDVLLFGNTNNTSFEVHLQDVQCSKAEKGLRLFMSELSSLIKGKDKFKLKTVKFHQILHYPYYIRKYGSPSNFDGAVPECIGKETAKHVGKHTQQREDTMNYQSAMRFAENCIIRMGFDLALHNNEYNTNKGFGEYFECRKGATIVDDNEITSDCILTDCTRNTITSSTGSKRYNIKIPPNLHRRRTTLEREKVLFKISGGQGTKLPRNTLQKHHFVSLLQDVVGFLRESNIIDRCRDIDFDLYCYSSMRLEKGITIRSAYEFYGDKGWYDWVNVDWGEHGILPAKVLLILDLKSLKDQMKKCRKEDMVVDYDVGDKATIDNYDDIMLVVQSVQQNTTNPNNMFVSKLGTLHKMEQQIHLISTSSVHSTCFVIPDLKYCVDGQDEANVLEKDILHHQCGMSSHNIISISDRSLFEKLFMQS